MTTTTNPNEDAEIRAEAVGAYREILDRLSETIPMIGEEKTAQASEVLMQVTRALEECAKGLAGWTGAAHDFRAVHRVMAEIHLGLSLTLVSNNSFRAADLRCSAGEILEAAKMLDRL